MAADMQLIRNALDRYVKPGLAFGPPGFNTLARQQQVLGTGFKESGYVHTVQMGGGPALGFFQMEPATHDDLIVNFIAYRPELASALYAATGSYEPSADRLRTDPAYAALMCGIDYLRSPIALPKPYDPFAQASMWKRAYNGPGKGVISDAVQYFRTANEVF